MAGYSYGYLNKGIFLSVVDKKVFKAALKENYGIIHA